MRVRANQAMEIKSKLIYPLKLDLAERKDNGKKATWTVLRRSPCGNDKGVWLPLFLYC